MRTILWALIFVAACGNDQATETTAELTRCEQLREHLIDLRLSTATNVDQDAHRQAMRTALGASFLDDCARTADRDIACALEATDAAAVAACSPH